MSAEQAEFDYTDAHMQIAWHERFAAAARAYCETHEYKNVAEQLESIFESVGHNVSAATLRASLNGTERNYWRGEWVPFFAKHVPECRALLDELLGLETEVTAEDLLAAMLDELEESGKAGRQIVTAAKARAKRRARRKR